MSFFLGKPGRGRSRLITNRSDHAPQDSREGAPDQGGPGSALQRGRRGHGIDAITDRAGVAKMSLSNTFDSKADLVQA
jgi:hypothetical protein